MEKNEVKVFIPEFPVVLQSTFHLWTPVLSTDCRLKYWKTQWLSWDYLKIMDFSITTGTASSFHNIKWLQKGNIHSVVANSANIASP